VIFVKCFFDHLPGLFCDFKSFSTKAIQIKYALFAVIALLKGSYGFYWEPGTSGLLFWTSSADIAL